MRLLVVYGSTDGHTRKIATAIADHARRTGVDVLVADVKANPPNDLSPFDAVIVAAPVHGGHYQSAVRHWVSHHALALDHPRTAFISVCLGVLQHDAKVDRELEEIMRHFFFTTRWTPSVTKIVAGAVPFTRYGWWKR